MMCSSDSVCVDYTGCSCRIRMLTRPCQIKLWHKLIEPQPCVHIPWLAETLAADSEYVVGKENEVADKRSNAVCRTQACTFYTWPDQPKIKAQTKKEEIFALLTISPRNAWAVDLQQSPFLQKQTYAMRLIYDIGDDSNYRFLGCMSSLWIFINTLAKSFLLT